MKRGEIREKFGIKGSGMGDCCASYWCGCCALIQQEKEVKARLAQGPVTQGYDTKQEGMHMPPQQQQPGVQPQQAGFQQQPAHNGSFPPPQQAVYNPHQGQPQQQY